VLRTIPWQWTPEQGFRHKVSYDVHALPSQSQPPTETDYTGSLRDHSITVPIPHFQVFLHLDRLVLGCLSFSQTRRYALNGLIKKAFIEKGDAVTISVADRADHPVQRTGELVVCPALFAAVSSPDLGSLSHARSHSPITSPMLTTYASLTGGTGCHVCVGRWKTSRPPTVSVSASSPRTQLHQRPRTIVLQQERKSPKVGVRADSAGLCCHFGGSWRVSMGSTHGHGCDPVSISGEF
jgi:hypothetical protein